MHRVVCLCAALPRIETRTRLVLLLHRDEERKPTNTGQLAALCLPNSTVLVTGDLARPLPTPLFRDEERPLLLFPDPAAPPLSSFVGGDKPIALVVPDGTWRQASKARNRIPGLAHVEGASLPEGPPTRYRLRAEPREGGLATIEAIARAMAVLEGEAASAALLEVFETMVERTLWTRGVIGDDDVKSGIPHGCIQQGAPEGTWGQAIRQRMAAVGSSPDGSSDDRAVRRVPLS
jgi:DTW domain-containing protein YfiP